MEYRRKVVTYFSSYLLFKDIVWWTLVFDMKKFLLRPSISQIFLQGAEPVGNIFKPLHVVFFYEIIKGEALLLLLK